MPRLIGILFFALIGLSITVVSLKHESRQRFARLQVLQAERDALNVEWGKLLLEEGAWSQHRRIEDMARRRLDMNLPNPESIRVVRVTPDRVP